VFALEDPEGMRYLATEVGFLIPIS